jgi:riboflavin synthase
MFTGLIETVGKVRAAVGNAPLRLSVASSLPNDEISIGDSVAIDGVCLTVVEKAPGVLTFEAATETLARTTMGNLAVGDRVHLERALQLGGRLDGHLVQGHVDGIGTVSVVEMRGSALYLGIDAPADVARLTVARGSIAIAGCSLTVTDVQADTIYVALIPHTVAGTRFGDLRRGAPVNLEADLLARYVEKLLGAQTGGGSLTVEFLKDKGFA